MDEETRGEFTRLESRIAGAAKLAIGIAIAIAVPVTSGALYVYAQVGHAVTKNGEQDAEIGKARETREKVIEIEQRVKAVEANTGEIKAEQREQRQILENIYRSVKQQ